MPIPVDELKKKEQDYEKNLELWRQKIVDFLKENQGKAFTFDEIVEETGAPNDGGVVFHPKIGHIWVKRRGYWYYKDSNEKRKVGKVLRRIFGFEKIDEERLRK